MVHKTLDGRYEGGWRNIKEDCQLCCMSKRTKWYFETQSWVIAEKLGGGPFIVYKKHQKVLSDEKWQEMERMIDFIFDDFEIEVIMAHCPNHFHAHIITDEDVDLSDE